MKVQFWGVRGSIPAPGPSTNYYGGNTPCVSVVDSAGHLCIIDMGTGIVPMGHALLDGSLSVQGDFGKGQGQATILLSHAHWDHIQGFPFFAPVFIPGNRFRVFGNASTAERVEAILEGQMNPQFSPIYTLKNLGADIHFEGVMEEQCFQVSELEICSKQLPHGETTSLGFRVREGDRQIIYASDVGYGGESIDSYVEFYRGSDLLIHDACYTPEEQAERKERGQSTYKEAARVAAKAEVKTLALFHYDQDHNDEQVSQSIEACKAELKSLGAEGVEVIGAREGALIEI